MTVEFRPEKPEEYKGTKIFTDGQRIQQVTFRTEHMPKGFPTEKFPLYLSPDSHYWMLTGAVDVEKGRIFVYSVGKGQKITPNSPRYSISHALFPENGLPAIVNINGKDHAGKFIPRQSPTKTK